MRNVPGSEKNAVYAAYGILSHRPYQYEIDHLISLELGGSNSASNLWPEAYDGPTNARDKDALENRLHAEVCGGQITLAQAQRQIVAQWTTGGAVSRRRRLQRRAAHPTPASTAPSEPAPSAAAPAKNTRHHSKDSGSAISGLLIIAAGTLFFFRWRRRRRRASTS